MMPETHQQELDIALHAVREAARLCQTVQQGISPETLEKKDKSPVTVADFGSQALICRTLAEAFPGDPVIGEEDAAALREPDQAHLLERVVDHVRSERPGVDGETVCGWIDHGGADAYSDRFWTLDPIDGTKGFLRAEQYAIALALIVDGRPTVAALACPNLPAAGDGAGASRGTILTAVRGEGAAAHPLDAEAGDDSGKPIRVSATADPAEARFCESVESGHTSHGGAASIAERLGITAEPVRLDSQAKYGVVARGEADIYLRLPTKPGYVEKIWDHAAGALVIEQAGGMVTDVLGRPLEFHHGPRLEANRGVVATNGPLHEPVLETIERLGLTEPPEA